MQCFRLLFFLSLTFAHNVSWNGFSAGRLACLGHGDPRYTALFTVLLSCEFIFQSPGGGKRMSTVRVGSEKKYLFIDWIETDKGLF